MSKNLWRQPQFFFLGPQRPLAEEFTHNLIWFNYFFKKITTFKFEILVNLNSAMSKTPVRYILYFTFTDIAASQTSLCHDSVFGNLKGKYLGKFTTVCKNILGCESRWHRGRCSRDKNKSSKISSL